MAAHQPHSFEKRAIRGFQWRLIFVEPGSREGRALQLRTRDEGVAALDAASLKDEAAALADRL